MALQGFLSKRLPAISATWLNLIDNFVIGTGLAPNDVTLAETFASVVPINKAYSPYNVLRYGADPTGVLDSTDAFNKATASAAVYTGNDTILKRKIIVPAGTYKLGGGNKSVFVRKGQHLEGEGIGATYYDLTGTSANTNPIFVMGKNSSGVTDNGGLFAEISGMITVGGPSAVPVISTTGIAGWSVHDIMFSSPGVGLLVDGGDGFVSRCYFDDGLTGIVLTGQNHLIDQCSFYLMNNQIQVNASCFDCNINNCQFEYAEIRSILLADAATNIKNLTVRGCTFLLNEQHAGHIAFIGLRSTGADIYVVGGNTFRNGKGPAVVCETGTGNIVVMENFIIDGAKTNPLYAQSTTAQGVDCSNMSVTLRNGVLRNLPGQPVTFGGTVATVLLGEALKFYTNTGGTTDITITNNQTTSTFTLKNIEGSGRRLFNSQGTVPVYAVQLHNWLAAIATSGASHFILVPYQFSNLYQVSLRVNINAAGSIVYRKSKLVFVQKDNDFSGTAKSFVNTATMVEGAANTNGLITFVAEFTAVGGGANIASSNSGDLAFSWPSTYSIESVDVQIIQ